MKLLFVLFVWTSLFGDVIDVASAIRLTRGRIYQNKYGYSEKKGDDPLVTAMSFRAFCDHRFDYHTKFFDPDAVKLGDSIYVAYYLFETFIKKAHPQIKYPYVLVTNESIFSHPIQTSRQNTNTLLYDPKCAAWFSKNMILSNHPKLFPIPVGQTCFEFGFKYALPILLRLSREKIKKENRCFLRIGNPKLESRSSALTVLKNKPFVFYISKKIRPHVFYDYISKSKFTIAPSGNGVDTCRFWEAIALNSIPITQHSPLDEMYEGTPCLIIDKWEELNEDFLQRSFLDIQSKLNRHQLSTEKAFMPYWKNLISKIQKEICLNQWKKSSLDQTLFDDEKMQNLSNLIQENLDPTSNVYIIGEGLALRALQYVNAFENQKAIICVDPYISDKQTFISFMQDYSDREDLFDEKILRKFKTLNTDKLSLTQIQKERLPTGLIFDFTYYYFNAFDRISLFWKELKKDSIVIVIGAKHPYVKKSLVRFSTKHGRAFTIVEDIAFLFKN